MKKILSVLISISFIFGILSLTNTAFANDSISITLNVMRNYNYSKEILNIVNEERAKVGSGKLIMDEELLECSMQRAAELAVYFSHTRPNGTNYDSLSNLCVSENICAGAGGPEAAMNSWMNSPGHKANLLRSSHKTIGIGCVFHNGAWYWVQYFGENLSKESSKTGIEYVDQTINISKDNVKLACLHTYVDYTDPKTYQIIDVELVDRVFEYSMYPNGFKPMIEGANTGDGCSGNNGFTGYYDISPKFLNYSSSNENVFTVDENGVVHIVATGNATLKASLKEDPSILVEKTISVLKDNINETPTTNNSNDAQSTQSPNINITSLNKQFNVSSVKLSTSSYTYDGKIKKPSVTVYDNDGGIIEKDNYSVKYASGRKNVGKYAVTVKFSGDYSGEKTVCFTIKPKSTTLSSVKAGSKRLTVKWKKQSTQTTGYQIQYSTSSKFSGAKTVTVSKNSTTSNTIKNLKSKKKYYVRVRTYKNVKVNGKTTKIYSSWSKSKSVKTK